MLRKLVVVLASSLTLTGPAMAQSAEKSNTQPIPVEDFARKPPLSRVSFSPSGNRFAAIRLGSNGRYNLVVGDLQDRKLSQITNFSTTDVGDYYWVGDGRLVFTVYQSDRGNAEQTRAGGIYAVNADGTDGRDLVDRARPFRFVRRIAGQDTDIIATGPERDEDSEDVLLVNTRTGKRTVLSKDNPGHVVRWVLDANNVPRAAIGCEGEKLSCTSWYRESADAHWRKIADYDEMEPSIRPVAFAKDGRLIVASNQQSDRQALYYYDPLTKQFGEKLADHPTADVNEVIIDPNDHQVLGTLIDADKPQAVWFDQSIAKIQQLMDASLPAGSFNQLRRLDNGKFAIASYSDRNPVTYYLYDPAGKHLEEVLRPTDWFAPERMASRAPIRYTARDGLSIPAYLTLPQGKAHTKLPLLVWVHGGPWARDPWGWDTEAQFFASRGYAVLQPNYRSSVGFGLKHWISGFKQLGLTMQDDITDGVKALIEQGIVDPQRVCIGGGSYGGYATLMGLVKEPGMFKCGIAVAGVTDLGWWQTLGYTEFNLSNPRAAEAFLSRTIGDLTQDKEQLQKTSPRNLAARIEAPVLIIHGANDRRVPIKHAEAMRDALRANGKRVEWLVYDGEGHGFSKPEHVIDYYLHMAKFLDDNIGGAH